MLARYKIYRGKLPDGVKLPVGIRQDIRKHTRHCLRSTQESVAKYLTDPTERTWKEFAASYLSTVQQRWQDDSQPFDELAELATHNDVYLGCSCPTEKNPEVAHCHTVLALQFMSSKYAEIEIRYP